MLQQYPSFTFNEKVIGPRPVRTFFQDVAGIVGQFARGFYNKAFPCDAAEAFQRYSKRGLLNGDVGMGAVYAQGASQFVLSAVHGSASHPTIKVALKGTLTVAGKATLTIVDSRGEAPVTTTYAPEANLIIGKTAKDALQAIVDLITADADGPVTATMDAASVNADASITVSAKTYGALAAGKLTAALTISGTGFTNNVPAVAADLVGINAPGFASCLLDNEDDADAVRLDVHYPEEWANTELTAKVIEGSMPSKRTIVVTNSVDNQVDTIKDVDLTDVENGDLLVASKGKIYVEAHVLDATKPLKVTTAPVAFTGGSNGAPVTTADYVRAVERLAEEFCTFVFAPGPMPDGVDRAAVVSALEAQVTEINEQLGEAYGLRVFVDYAERGLTEQNLVEGYVVSDSDCIVKVVGWVTPAFAPKLRRFGASPDGFYIGKAMMTPYHVSVAARSSSPAYKGVIECDSPVGVKVWNKITAYRMDAIVYDRVLKTYQNLNGRTTTSSPTKCYWLCWRRVMNMLRTEIFQLIYTIMAEPSDRNLDNDVMERCNNRLAVKLKTSVIAGYNPTVSNDTNNPAAVRNAGKRVVDLGVELIPPNDFTEVNIERVQTATVRV